MVHFMVYNNILIAFDVQIHKGELEFDMTIETAFQSFL